jgi:serine/threonine protein kinase
MEHYQYLYILQEKHPRKILLDNSRSEIIYKIIDTYYLLKIQHIPILFLSIACFDRYSRIRNPIKYEDLEAIIYAIILIFYKIYIKDYSKNATFARKISKFPTSEFYEKDIALALGFSFILPSVDKFLNSLSIIYKENDLGRYYLLALLCLLDTNTYSEKDIAESCFYILYNNSFYYTSEDVPECSKLIQKLYYSDDIPYYGYVKKIMSVHEDIHDFSLDIFGQRYAKIKKIELSDVWKEDNFESLNHKYKKDVQLGKGAFGIVNLGYDEKGKEYAIKEFGIKKWYLPRDILVEISILRDCTHKNIIMLHDLYFENNTFNIVLPLLDFDLFELFITRKNPFKTKEIKFWFKQIVQGTKYLHDNYIVHRDLKPENILIDNTNQIIKIADFGLSKITDTLDGNFTPLLGTPSFVAPEVYLQLNHYSYKVDIWALGCILYQFVKDDHNYLFQRASIEDMLSDMFKKLGIPDPNDWEDIRDNKYYLKAISNRNSIKDYYGKQRISNPNPKVREEFKIKYESILKGENETHLQKIKNLLPSEINDNTLIDLFDNILVLNPNDRYNCDNILSHDFLNDKLSTSLNDIKEDLPIEGYEFVDTKNFSIEETYDMIDELIKNNTILEITHDDKLIYANGVNTFDISKYKNTLIITMTDDKLVELYLSKNHYVWNFFEKLISA